LQNIRLDDWYSLANIRQPNPAVHDIHFRDIWAMDSLAMVRSAFVGDITDVSFKGVDLYSKPATSVVDIPLTVSNGAAMPTFEPNPLDATFLYQPGVLRPRMPIYFQANGHDTLSYQWLFGDGTSAVGAKVRHAFSDAHGTLLDGSGRYRVLLHVTDGKGDESWSSRSVVISNRVRSPLKFALSLTPGWNIAHTDGDTTYDGYIRIPANGGYTFTLLTSTTARMVVDGGLTAYSPEKQPQVCGSVGDAVQPVRLSAVLQKGLHRITITKGPEQENAVREPPSDLPLLFWEGPDLESQPVPQSAMQHRIRVQALLRH
jgi:hypothetical protein